MTNRRSAPRTQPAAAPPGLQGDRTATCIACIRPTDTALAFAGPAEWILAGLHTLGVPPEQAYLTMLGIWRDTCGTGDGMVPDGWLTQMFRICRDCVRRCPAAFPDPVLAIPGAVFPVIACPARDIR